MRTVFAYIFALLLIVPFHTLTYVRTILHLVQHNAQPDGHEHHETIEDSDYQIDHHHEHDLDHSPPESGSRIDFSHRHAPNQAVHSHEMDIWGLFSNPGVCTQVTRANFPDYVSIDPPMLDTNSIISDPILSGLLRPPIA